MLVLKSVEPLPKFQTKLSNLATQKTIHNSFLKKEFSLMNIEVL